MAFNAAAKVAPAASFIGVKQGFTTYDQAIRTGFPEEEATRLAWFSGLIEGATTIAFSAAGAGGVESIVSGSSREAFRQSVRASVKSAWEEGAKAFGKGVLGEMAEEEFITLLDTALVQTTLNPNMTAEDVRRAFYETAIVSLVTSGPFAAFHGKQVHGDTAASNQRIGGEQAGTLTSGTEAETNGTTLPVGEKRSSPRNPYRNAEGKLPTTPYHRSATDPDLAEKEAEFNGILNGPVQEADKAYNAIPETHGGKVIGTDLAREVSPHYRTPEGRARYTGITTGTASQYGKDRLWREIHDKGNRKSLLFTAGGPASGKSTVVSDKLISQNDVIYDGTLRDQTWAIENIEAANTIGWESTVINVIRPLKLAAKGAVERAITEGRPFALADLPDAHYAAQRSVVAIAKHFKDAPQVHVLFYVNSGETRNIPAQSITLAQVDTGGEYSYDDYHGTESGRVAKSPQESDSRSGLERFRSATRGDIVGVFRDAVEGRITVDGKQPSKELLIQLAGRDEELQRILKESGR